MSELMFGTDLFGEFDRLNRRMEGLFGAFPASIRSSRMGSYPAVNVGVTDDSIEIVLFAPGVDPNSFDVSIEKGLLTVAGQRTLPAADDGAQRYAQERFSGPFRRVIELPTAADAGNVQARYVDGCLSIRVGKLETSKPRSITVQ